MPRPFKLTEKQNEANKILGGRARHILLRGGSRSGKTFVICRAIAIRAFQAPRSTHAILRFRFNHLKDSIVNDTFPGMMEACFGRDTENHVPFHTNRSDWFIEFPNGSKVLFGGLDDKERTEKILGQEHSSIFLNECSQISYASRNKAVTRLAQTAMVIDPKTGEEKGHLPLRAYYDENPPKMGHWTHKMFMKLQEPLSGADLPNPHNFATLQMNPGDNLENLPEGYIEELEALPERERRRFLLGEFQAQVDDALWTYDTIDKCRVSPGQVPELARIVIAVDPSGCQGPEDLRSDEIGIVVAGRGVDGKAYVLEDLSGRYSPDGWAKASLKGYDLHEADIIVAERNYGGEMVRHTIQSVRPGVNVKLVTASRGKTQRAEPISALYEQGKVKHVDTFPEMEDQMCNFSTSGYSGDRSPDRADALIWALTELMLKRGVSERVRLIGA